MLSALNAPDVESNRGAREAVPPPGVARNATLQRGADGGGAGPSPQPRPREPRPRRRSRSLRSERESGRPARAATRQLQTPVAAVSNLHKAVDLVHNI